MITHEILQGEVSDIYLPLARPWEIGGIYLSLFFSH